MERFETFSRSGAANQWFECRVMRGKETEVGQTRKFVLFGHAVPGCW